MEIIEHNISGVLIAILSALTGKYIFKLILLIVVTLMTTFKIIINVSFKRYRNEFDFNSEWEKYIELIMNLNDANNKPL